MQGRHFPICIPSLSVSRRISLSIRNLPLCLMSVVIFQDLNSDHRQIYSSFSCSFLSVCLRSGQKTDCWARQTLGLSRHSLPYTHCSMFPTLPCHRQCRNYLLFLSSGYYLGNYTRNCTKQMVSSPIDTRQVSRLTIIPLPCYTNNINLSDGYFA